MMDNCDKHGPYFAFCRMCDVEPPPMTPSPEDVERMIEDVRAIAEAMRMRGFFAMGAKLDAAADMLAALSAIGGDE